MSSVGAGRHATALGYTRPENTFQITTNTINRFSRKSVNSMVISLTGHDVTNYFVTTARFTRSIGCGEDASMEIQNLGVNMAASDFYCE